MEKLQKSLFTTICLLTIFSHSNYVFGQEEFEHQLEVCKGECFEIGIKKKKSYRYEWRAFGEKINLPFGQKNDNPSKIEVCPIKKQHLYYVNVYDKANKHIMTHSYSVTTFELEITTEPAYVCIMDNQPIEVTIKEKYKNYKWSNAVTGPKIIVDKAQKITVSVEDNYGCKEEKEIVVVNKSSKKTEAYFKDKGFYSTPIGGVKKKKKGKN